MISPKSFSLLLIPFLTLLHIVCSSCAAISIPAAASHLPIWHRLVYQFFHANILHLMLNCWCFLQLVFGCRCGWRFIIPAYIISIFIPAPTPTIGLSAVCYAMMGMLVPLVARRVFFSSFLALSFAATFFLPSFNTWAHIYATIAGLIYSLIFIYHK